MKDIRALNVVYSLISFAIMSTVLLAACAPQVQELEPYAGPKASLAVAHFSCEKNCGPRKQTGLEYGNRSLPAMTITLAEDLAQRLTNSQRFRVVEPAQLGFVREYSSSLDSKGTDLLLLATIIEADTDKDKAGNGNVLGGLGFNAESQTAFFKVHFEVYDVAMNSVVYTTELEASSANLTTSFSANDLDESLGFYSGTALPDAIEQVMQQALYNISSNLPNQYFRY